MRARRVSEARNIVFFETNPNRGAGSIPRRRSEMKSPLIPNRRLKSIEKALTHRKLSASFIEERSKFVSAAVVCLAVLGVAFAPSPTMRTSMLDLIRGANPDVRGTLRPGKNRCGPLAGADARDLLGDGAVRRRLRSR